MKLIYLTIGFYLLMYQPGISQERISIANGYADKGDHVSAINAYKLILDEGPYAEVHYNLANSYLALDSIPQSILHYERALKYRPSDDDIINNLAIARGRVQNQVTVIPEFFLFRFWKNWVMFFSPNVWAWISVLLVLSFCGIFYLKTYEKINLRFRYYVLSLGLILTLLFLSFVAAWKGKQRAVASDKAIIFSEVILKSGPDERSNDIKVLYPGYKIYLLDDLSGWKKVRTEDREIGYVLPSSYEVI